MANQHEQALVSEHLAPGAAGEETQTLVFDVAVNKRSGTSLGIDVTWGMGGQQPRTGMFVAKVFQGGIVEEWNNNSQEPRKLRCGDLIYQVNEVAGVPVAMIDEIQKKSELVLHVMRRQELQPAEEIAANDASESVERLLPQLIGLEDQELAGLVGVTLERRPWLQKAVLGSSLPWKPSGFVAPPQPQQSQAFGPPKATAPQLQTRTERQEPEQEGDLQDAAVEHEQPGARVESRQGNQAAHRQQPPSDFSGDDDEGVQPEAEQEDEPPVGLPPAAPPPPPPPPAPPQEPLGARVVESLSDLDLAAMMQQGEAAGPSFGHGSTSPDTVANRSEAAPAL